MLTTPSEQEQTTVSVSEKSSWILFAVCILGIMIQIDFTAVNVALIAIGHSLHANLNMVQWSLSAYVLAWGALLLTAGRCADLFGKRRTFLTGTLLFMLGSALTGMATQAWFLIFGRVVQGIGGALFLPGLYTLVFTAFPEHRRGYALGILTSMIAIGMAIGPTFGGIILHLLNWRWIFFLNLPLGIPVIAIILWAVPREPWQVLAEPMDYVGAVLIAAALGLLMFSLNQVGTWNINSPQFLLTFGAALILLGVFVIYEYRQTYPLIQLAMFRNRIFLGCSLGYIIMGFTFSTILIIGGLYLQNGLDYSAMDTGFIFLIMTAMFAWLSVYGGKLVDRMDARVPILLGGLATMAAAFIFTLCTHHSPLWMPMLALGLYGIGGGLGFPALDATMMKSVPQNLLSTASSAFAMFGCVGNTLGLILSSVLLITFSQRQLNALLTPGWRLSSEQSQLLNAVISSPHYNAAQLKGFPAAQIPDLLNILRDSFMHGMTAAMMVIIALSLIGIIICGIMIKK